MFSFRFIFQPIVIQFIFFFFFFTRCVCASFMCTSDGSTYMYESQSNWMWQTNSKANKKKKKLKNWQSPKCSFTMFYLIFHYCLPYSLRLSHPSLSLFLLHSLSLLFSFLQIFVFVRGGFARCTRWHCCSGLGIFRWEMYSFPRSFWHIPKRKKYTDAKCLCVFESKKSAPFQFSWNKSFEFSNEEKPIVFSYVNISDTFWYVIFSSSSHENNRKQRLQMYRSKHCLWLVLTFSSACFLGCMQFNGIFCSLPPSLCLFSL